MVAKVLGLMRVCLCMGFQQIKSERREVTLTIHFTAILEWTLSNVQQNIEQLHTPTIGKTINKKSTTTEPSPQNGQ